jgi:hypothetical protein
MGRWDCSSCGTKGVLGDQYSCSGCAAPRPDDVEFYLPGDAEVITDEAGVAAAEAGADWQCEYCDSWLPATVDSCTRCSGGEIADAKKQETKDYASRAAVPVARAIPVARAVPVVRTVSAGGGSAAGALDGTAEGGSKSGKSCLGACLAGVVLIAGCLVASLFVDTTVVVGGHSWERTHEVEVLRTVGGGGWEVPDGAFDVASEQKVSRYDKVYVRTETRSRTEAYTERDGTRPEKYSERVSDGYSEERYTERVKSGSKRVKAGVKNLGNGRFKQLYKNVPTYKKVSKTRRKPRFKTVWKTRQVPRYVKKTRQVPYEEKIYRKDPVYQTYYTYRITRWIKDEPVVLRGAGTTPRWPERNEGEDRRVVRERGVYRVTFARDGKPVALYSMDEDRWRGFEVGQTIDELELERLARDGAIQR